MAVEGRADRVTDDARLTRLAELWEAKYSADWHFEVRAGAFANAAGGRAEVFGVVPRTAFGLGKGEPYSQTRRRFR